MQFSDHYSSMTSDSGINYVRSDNFSNSTLSLFYNASVSLADDSLGENETINLTTLPEDKEYIFDRLTVRTIFIIVYTIVFCSCFFGNLLVILVVTLHWRMRSITNFCLANLAFANLCVGVFCVYQNLSTYLITSWVFGDFMCKMYHFINSLSHTASILILVVICIERYLAIIHPIKSRQIFTIRRQRVCIVAVWITSAIYCSPRLYYIATITIPRRDGEIETLCIPKRTLYDSQTFDIINFLLIFLVPMTVISVLYTIIGISLWRSSRNQMTTTMPAVSSSSLHNQNQIQDQSSRGSLSQIEIPTSIPVGDGENNISKISISNDNEQLRGDGKASASRWKFPTSTRTKRSFPYASRLNRGRVEGNKSGAGSTEREKKNKHQGNNTYSTSEEQESEDGECDGDSFAGRNIVKKKKLSSILSSRLSSEAEPFRPGLLCCLSLRRESRNRNKRKRITEQHLSLNPNSISISNCEDCEDNDASTIFHSQIQSNRIHRELNGDAEQSPCHVNVAGHPNVVPSISMMTVSSTTCEVDQSFGILVRQVDNCATAGLGLGLGHGHGHGHGHVLNSKSNVNPSRNEFKTMTSSGSYHGQNKLSRTRQKQLSREKEEYLYGDGEDCPNSHNHIKKGTMSSSMSTIDEVPVKDHPNQSYNHSQRDNSVPKMKLRRVGAMKSCRIGSQALNSRRRVVRMLIVIVVTFAICNLPFHGRKLWQIWSSSYEGGSMFSTLFTPITFLIMYANCAINPILYAFMSTTFRASFRDLISCRLRRQQRAQDHLQVTTTTSSSTTHRLI